MKAACAIMLREALPALRITIVSIVLLGFIYPLAMTGLMQAAFPEQANGMLVRADGRVVGSAIVGQKWRSARYFHGRPSAAGKGDDPTATGGTNLAPTSAKLIANVRAAIARLKKENPGAGTPLPIDLVTASASGIDPDISPQAAYYQAARVARARGVPVRRVDALIRRAIEPRTWGILGNSRVNVLLLNLALDRMR